VSPFGGQCHLATHYLRWFDDICVGLMIVGDIADYLIGLVAERFFYPQASVPIS
jgi:hypothetical protein